MANEKNIEPHKFQPGESGNPAGRPKGSRNLSTILKEMLEEEITVDLGDGKKAKKAFKEVIIRKLIKKAADGSEKAIATIFDRVDGKAQQFIDVSSGGEPITAGTHVVEFRDYTRPQPEAKSKAKPKKKPKK